MNPLEEAISPRVRAIQLIIGSLLMGVLIFGIMVTTVLKGNLDQDQAAKAAQAKGFEGVEFEEPAPLLQYIGYGFAAVAIAMFSIVGPFVRNQGLKQVPSPLEDHLDQSIATYVTGKIISAAILEGAAFFNLVTYMLEGAIGNLAVAGILAIGIASLFPTVSSVANWFTDAVRQRTETDSYTA